MGFTSSEKGAALFRVEILVGCDRKWWLKEVTATTALNSWQLLDDMQSENGEAHASVAHSK